MTQRTNAFYQAAIQAINAFEANKKYEAEKQRLINERIEAAREFLLIGHDPAFSKRTDRVHFLCLETAALFTPEPMRKKLGINFPVVSGSVAREGEYLPIYYRAFSFENRTYVFVSKEKIQSPKGTNHDVLDEYEFCQDHNVYGRLFVFNRRFEGEGEMLESWVKEYAFARKF